MKAALAIAGVVFLLLTAPALAQGLPGPQPAPITVRNEITVSAPAPDPTVVAQSAVTSGEAIVSGVVVPPIVQWDNSLLDMPDLWRTTPPEWSYNNPTIRQLAELIRNATFVLIAIAIFVMGVTHALQGGGASVPWGRVLFAAVLSIGNLTWWEILISVNNAINAQIRAPDVKPWAAPHLVMPTNPLEAFGDVAMVLVFGIVLLLTLISLVMRLGLLDVLIAAGSFMLLLFAHEDSASWAAGYIKVSVGTTLSQVLMVIGLVTAQVLGGLGTGIVGSLLAVVVLLLVRSLPSTMAGIGRAGGGGGGWAGRIFQLVVLRRLALR